MSFRGGANAQVLQDGVLRGQRPGINFHGLTAVDDPANKRVNVSLGILGKVNADGTIAAGTGFTVVKGAAGVYTINFNTAFAAVPVVIAECIVSGNISTLNPAPTVNGFGLTTGSPGAVDTPFNFIAVGVA